MGAPKGNENPTPVDPPAESLRPVHILKVFGFGIVFVLVVWLAIVLILHFVFPRTDWLISMLLATLAAAMLAGELLFEAFFLALWHGPKKLFRRCFRK